MSKFRLPFNALAVAIFTLFAFSAAHAQATRTWVSGVGDDVNPCSRTAPCKTFAGAISKTAINGEIDCLDPGGFGTVTITKSITIDGTTGSGFGSILSSGTNGVNVNIASGNVNDPLRQARLRNLDITGVGLSGAVGTRTGLDGIRFLAGSTLIIESTVISDFTSDGIEVSGPVGEANQMNLILNDVTITNCTGTGIRATHNNASGQVAAMIDNSRFQNSGTGILATNRTRFGINRSVFSHDTTGLQTTGSNNIFNIDDIFVTYATTGINNGAGNTLRISDSVVTQNSTGFSNAGTLVSLQGNSVFGNTVDGFAPGTTQVKQ
jgi:hypothetical protein